jgi:hypothetical protein
MHPVAMAKQVQAKTIRETLIERVSECADA